MADMITQAELAEALRSLLCTTERTCDGASSHRAKALSPEEAAASVFRLAQENREPAYDDGAVYVDAYGEYWRYNSPRRDWSVFGAADASAFHVPRRPLRKVTPEPGDDR